MQCDILKHFGKKKKPEKLNEPLDSPLQVQLIKFLGLKNYFVDKFVFRRKQSKYSLARHNNQGCILMPRPYEPPAELQLTVKLLESSGISTPVLILKHKQPHDNYIIIYSHGNSSDMSDGLVFLESLALEFRIDVLGYDYSGYGESRVHVIGEETIVRDLLLIIAWLKRPIEKIILWGFSLGTFPTVCNASIYQNIGGMVLQCPIASINCMFQKDLTPKTKFRQDHFSNIDRISSVKCMSFIVHSIEDEIIPVTHARLLFQKYSEANGKDRIWFLEVNKLHHNSIHKYFVSRSDNDLKSQFKEFLREVRKNKSVNSEELPKRMEDRAKVKEAELDEGYEFDEGDYELTAISQSKEIIKPGRQFNNNRRTLPKCFSID